MVVYIRELMNVDEQLKELEHRMNARFDGFEKRFDGMEKRLDSLEKRFDGFEKRFDGFEKRFDRMEKMVADLIGIVGRTNGMVSDMQQGLDNVHSDIKRMDGQSALVEKRLDWQRGKIGQLEEAVATK